VQRIQRRDQTALKKSPRRRGESSPLRILYVGYALLPVNDQSCGGAEQMLWTLEREVAAAGHITTVAATTESKVSGGLYATGAPGTGSLQSAAQYEAAHHSRTLELIHVREMIGRPFHLIHDESGSFFSNAHKIDVPVLATLHLPRYFYPRHLFSHLPSNLRFNCVSQSQLQSFSGLENMIGAVPNGICLERFPLQVAKRDYLLWMGRICEEKGAHIALDLADKLGMPVVTAGQVYPFSYHQRYFEREILPRIDRMAGRAKLIRSPDFDTKVELLQNARAVLVPSLVDETSSLVAMEAAACGTPVIAFRRGALPEVVQHGVTGFLVTTRDQMMEAVADVSSISPRQAHEYAQVNYSATEMAAAYLKIYEQLAAGAGRSVQTRFAA
jgi:glycosyltransferase involved in cell wall biosynthesis